MDSRIGLTVRIAFLISGLVAGGAFWFLAYHEQGIRISAEYILRHGDISFLVPIEAGWPFNLMIERNILRLDDAAEWAVFRLFVLCYLLLGWCVYGCAKALSIERFLFDTDRKNSGK